MTPTQLLWQTLFAGVTSMQFHPGNKTPMSPNEIADFCDRVINYLEERKCRGLEQSSAPAQAWQAEQ